MILEDTIQYRERQFAVSRARQRHRDVHGRVRPQLPHDLIPDRVVVVVRICAKVLGREIQLHQKRGRIHREVECRAEKSVDPRNDTLL